ncbi:hypothetical protein [Chroococcidiopsis sp.]|uniref:hypothetical protein n=1 Tax=Chroococcidiopsis sp. TaxID=3088168 RepID=UPI003F2B8EC2
MVIASVFPLVSSQGAGSREARELRELKWLYGVDTRRVASRRIALLGEWELREKNHATTNYRQLSPVSSILTFDF